MNYDNWKSTERDDQDDYPDDREQDLIICDCGEIATWQDTVDVDPWTTRIVDHCDECHDRHVNYEPPEPDGECFRGGEAAAFASEQQAAAQRLK